MGFHSSKVNESAQTVPLPNAMTPKLIRVASGDFGCDFVELPVAGANRTVRHVVERAQRATFTVHPEPNLAAGGGLAGLDTNSSAEYQNLAAIRPCGRLCIRLPKLFGPGGTEPSTAAHPVPA